MIIPTRGGTVRSSDATSAHGALIERERQLAILQGMIDDVGAHRTHVATVTGPASSGKTALLSATAEMAAAAGCICLAVRGIDDGWRASTVLHNLMVTARNAASGSRGSGERESGADTQTSGEEARDVASLRELLRACGRDAPVAIILDDAHLVDDHSLRVLLRSVSPAAPSAVMLVLGDLQDHHPRRSLLHRELASHPRHVHLPLTALSPAGVARMVGASLGPVTSAALDMIQRVGGGNPLLTKALIEDVRDSLGSASPAAGDHYTYALVGCLHRLGGHALRLARALAVLGDEPGITTAAALAGLPDAAARRAVSALERASIIVGTRFRDQHAARAVLDDIEPVQYAELHRRAARLLHAKGSPATDVARHAIASGAPAEAWLREVFEAAAIDLLRQGRPGGAIDVLEHAERADPDGAPPAAITGALARAHARSDMRTASRHAGRLLIPARNSEAALGEALAVSPLLLWDGRAREVLQLLEPLDVPVPQKHPFLVERLAATTWLACLHPEMLQGSRELLDWMCSDDLSHSAAIEPRISACRALAGVLLGHSPARITQNSRRALSLMPCDDEHFASHVAAVTALLFAGQLRLAEQWSGSLYEQAGSRAAPTWQAVAAALRGHARLQLGDPDGALRVTQDALDMLRPEAWGSFIGIPLATVIDAAALGGLPEPPYAHAGRSLSPEALQSLPGLVLQMAQGRYALSAGDAETAAVHFRRCGDLVTTWQIDHAMVSPWRTMLAKASAAAGRAAEARHLIAEQLTRLGGAPPRTRGLAHRLAAEILGGDQRETLLSTAMAEFTACDDRRGLAATQALAERRPRTAEAAPRPRASTRPGSPAAAAAPLPVSERLAVLSDAERRVVLLAAARHSNRAIAGELFVTVSTVEQHLTRAYRKLGISGREQLPALVAGQSGSPTISADATHNRSARSRSWDSAELSLRRRPE